MLLVIWMFPVRKIGDKCKWNYQQFKYSFHVQNNMYCYEHEDSWWLLKCKYLPVLSLNTSQLYINRTPSVLYQKEMNPDLHFYHYLPSIVKNIVWEEKPI